MSNQIILLDLAMTLQRKGAGPFKVHLHYIHSQFIEHPYIPKTFKENEYALMYTISYKMYLLYILYPYQMY